MADLQSFLYAEARKIRPYLFETGALTIERYLQNVNEDALSDVWLDNGTSYIWKVGVLTIIDGNKRDWAYAFIGHHREPNRSCEFIGVLHWRDGENADPGPCLRRYVSLLSEADIIFEDL